MRCHLIILWVAVVCSNAKDIETVVGIDVGSTNSYIGVYRDGRVEIIGNEKGNHMTPSYVAFNNGKRLIGDAAKEQAMNNNLENTIFNVKRLLGQEWRDKTIIEDVKRIPFEVIEKNNKYYFSIEGVEEVLSSEEIAAMVIKRMKVNVEAYIAKNVSYAVVTVPTYFNDEQRLAAKEACTIAGLKVLRVINKPSAAVMAYGLQKAKGEKNFLVFDIGGSTFDVSIINIDNGVLQIFVTSKDTEFGGNNFDELVLEYFIQKCKERGEDINSDHHAVRKLKREVEKAKQTLSSDLSAKIEIKSFFHDNDLFETLTRDKFEEINMDLFNSTLASVEKVLEEAEMSKYDIDEIVLAGGSTKIPKIQQLVKEFFGKEPLRSIEPDVVVAYGAAVFADMIFQEPEPPVHITVNPLTIGIETVGGVMTTLIPRNTITPTKHKQIFSTANDNQTTVTIKVYVGERSMTKDNHLIGQLDLSGISNGPKGKPQIEVTIAIDANEMWQVIAEDKYTGIKETLVIDYDPDRWTAEYIEQMIVDAEKFADDDKKAKDSVKNGNNLLLEGQRDVQSEENKKMELKEIDQGNRERDEL